MRIERSPNFRVSLDDEEAPGIPRVRRSDTEAIGARGPMTPGYRPLEAEGLPNVYRDPEAERLRSGMNYHPLRAEAVPTPDFSPARAGGRAGDGNLPVTDFGPLRAGSEIRGAKAIGTGGLGSVIGMGFVEVAAGLAALAEVASGGYLGADTRRALNEQAAQIFDNLAPDVQAALSREFTDLGPEGVLQNPSSYGYQLAKQIPILASLLVPGGIGAGVGARVGGRVAANRLGAATAARITGGRGPLAPVSEAAANRIIQSGRRAGIATGTTIAGPAGEGAVVAGMTANDIASGIEAAPDSVLMEAPLYAEARNNGATEAEAKRMLITELGRREAMFVGAGSAALSVIPSAVFGRILAGTTKRPWTEALIAQPVTEMIQEPYEGYRGDVAAQQSYDPSRVPGEDTFERAVAGGALGLGTGAAIVGTGVVGRRVLGVDKIAENDTTGQQLGDPGLAEAIPTTPPPPPSPQMGFDFGPTPESGPPTEQTYNNRRGETLPVPPRPVLTEEQQAADANLDRVEPAVESRSRIVGPADNRREFVQGDMQFGTEAIEARRVAQERRVEADEAAAYDEEADQQLRILTNRLEQAGVIDRLTGKPVKKASDRTKEEKRQLKELEDLRKANPQLAAQLELEQLEARVPEEWIVSSRIKRDGEETGTVAYAPAKGLSKVERAAVDRLLQLRAELAAQTEMSLPPAPAGRFAERTTRDETMRRAAQQPRALPAPPPDETAAEDELYETETQELRSTIQMLEEQESLSSKDKARLTSLRRRLKKLEGTPAAERKARQARIEDRRQRAAGTETETGEAIPLGDEFRTLETRGPRRGVRSRTQLQLQTVDPKETEAKIGRLSKLISERRAAGLNVANLIQQRKGLLRQLESMAGRPARETQMETLREELAAAEAESARLEAEPTPVYGRGAKKEGEVNEKKAAELEEQKAAARARVRRLRAEMEQAEAPETEPEQEDTKTKDLFGARRTPEADVKRRWNLKKTDTATAKGLLQDNLRASMLEMVTALGGSGVYSNATSRAMLRVRGELARRIKGAKSKEDLLRALHELAYDQRNNRIGDTQITVLDLADRVYRNLTGEPLPAEGAFATPDTVEQLLEVATEGRAFGGATQAVIEGADPTEAENITAAEELLTGEELAQRAMDAAEQASQEVSAAAMGVTEAELAELGRLDEVTSDELDAAENVELGGGTNIADDPEAFAKYVASEETADPYAVSLPATDATTELQRLADRVSTELVEMFGVREAKRLMRQTLALFREGGLFASDTRAREVLTRWRGNVMLYAIQEGDSDLQTSVAMMTEMATPDLQAAWFLRTMATLANDPALEMSLREMLGGRDTHMLRELGGVTEQLRQMTDYTQLGEQITKFGTLTTKSDEELMAMTHTDLRKYIGSRLGVEMPRKGKKEKGYTKEDMVRALRDREAIMRDAFEVFTQADPALEVSDAQWTQIITEGLQETKITDEQLNDVLFALDLARKKDNAKDVVTELRKVLSKIFPTDHKYIAVRDKILQREAVAIARINHKRIFNMMNRVSQRFGKYVKEQADKAALTGRSHTYMPPHKMAEQVANDIEVERRDRTTAARQEGAARGRLTQALARERERLQDPEYQAELADALTKAQLRVIYGRVGLPVPGEADLPAASTVEGGRELGEERAAEGRRFYGAVNAGDLPLEKRTDELPVNVYLRLGDPDFARSYIDNEIRRFLSSNPEATPPQIAKHLRSVLEVPAATMQENRKTGRLTDAQFVNLLEGLGFTKSFPETRLGENFDRNFAVNQILNSIHAFGTPVFTGGQFLNEYLRPTAMSGAPQYSVVAALGTAHESAVRAIARYLNNDNEVPGNKSEQMRFIMASDRVQQMWSEGTQARNLLESPPELDREGEATIADLSPEEKLNEIERLNEVLAEYDRLQARYANNPVVLEAVLQQRKLVTELRDLLKTKDPMRNAKRRVAKSHDAYIALLENRIAETKARIGTLKSELGASKRRDRDWQNRKQTGATNTRTHYLEASLRDAQMDLVFLQDVAMVEAKKARAKAVSAPPIMTMQRVMQEMAQLDARLNEITEGARTGQLVNEQLQEDASVDAAELNESEQAKRLDQLRGRQARVWPRMNSSLESIVAWANSANDASRRVINEIVSALHKNRDPKDMVTTSSMETIAPYSNETVVGSKLVEWLFMVKERGAFMDRNWSSVRNQFALPPIIRGSVAEILQSAAKDPRYNATVSFNNKSHKLRTLTPAQFNKLRDEVRAAYVKNPTAQLQKKMDTLSDFASIDGAMRYAYVKAYNMIGDIHQARRVTQSGAGSKRARQTPEQAAEENAKLLAKLPGAKAEVIKSKAQQRTLTPQQRRAAQEEQRQAEHTAAPESETVVEGWVDNTPEAQITQLEEAVANNTVLPQFYTFDREGNKVPSMGLQKRRLQVLREQVSQTVGEAEANKKARERQIRAQRKGHMDLPMEEARNQILGSSIVGESLRAARSRPTNVLDIVNQLIESGAIDDLPFATRFMLQAAQKLGIDIPIKWVDSKPVDGKTFLGRFAFDKDNPARGREIQINGYAYDSLLDKELDLHFTDRTVDGRLAHVFAHELAHAVTHMRLITDPALQREFGTLLGVARSVLGTKAQGTKDVFEFVAEFFSNEKFQRDLQYIRVTHDGQPMSLWQRMVDIVRQIFLMPRRNTAMFDYIMDRSSALFMSEQMVEQFAQNDMPHELGRGYLNYEITMDTSGAVVANNAELAAEQAERANWVLSLEGVLRKGKLGLMTLDQIGESYAGIASGYTNLQNKKWAEINRDMDSATRMMQDFAALGKTVSDRLSTVMLRATNYSMHPDQPLGPNTLNAHLDGSKETLDTYNSIKAMYDSLPDEAKQMYQAVKARHAEDYAKTTRFVTNNLMAAFDFDVDNLPSNWYEKLQSMESAEDQYEYLSDLWDKHALPDPKTGKKRERGFTEREAEALARLARRPKMFNGPYFPMKRFGKYLVRAKREVGITFKNEAEMSDVLSRLKAQEPGVQFSGFEGESLSGTITFSLVEMYENRGQAVKRRAQVFKEPLADMMGRPIELGGQQLTWGQIPEVVEKNALPMYELAGHYSSSFLTRLQNKLQNNPAALAAVKEAYLHMLPDTSMRKHELRRGNVLGASEDMIRSFAATTKASAYGNAQIKYGRQLSNEMQAMRERAKNDYKLQAVVDELQKRDMTSGKLMSEDLLATSMDRLTETGFVWYLGSPSYWMVNATQPYLLTLPYLSARYGTKESYAALARARKLVFPTLAGKAARSGLGLKAMRRDPKAHREFMRDIFGGLDDLFKGITDPNMRAMMEEVEQLGLIDLTIAKDLNQVIKAGATNKVEKAWESVVDMTRVMPHLVEVLNRSMTAIAAYDLATKKGMGHEQATAVAIDTIRKTQFNYSAINKARFMSRTTSELLRPVMLFMQYTQHVYYLMLRSAVDSFSEAKTAEERAAARKTFLRIMGAHTIAAGTLGGMFEPFRIALGLGFMLGQSVGMFDDDDEFEAAWQRMGYQMFGETGGQIFSKGVPYALLGIDLHTRVGLNNLIWMNDPRVDGMEGREWLVHKTFGMFGPLGDMAGNFADVKQKWQRGDATGAMASLLPKGLRDPLNAIRWQDAGVLDYTGNTIMNPEKMDAISLVYKFFGFNPSNVSQMYSSRGAVRRAEARINKKRSRLMERWRRAEGPAQQKVLEDIREFNRVYPEFRIDGKSRIEAKRRKRENEQQAGRQGGYYSGRNVRQRNRVMPYGEF